MSTTLADIGREVGVSITTVSKVLTGKADHFRISKTTQEKIWRVAREMDYAPDMHARSLRAKRTNQIGIIVSHFNDLWYGQVIHGLESVLVRNGYGFLINSIEEDPTNLAMGVARMRANRIEALILVGSRLELPRALAQRLKRSHTPVILVNRRPRYSWFSSVVFDHVHTGTVSTQHLVDLGHRRIGVLLGPANDPGNEARLTGHRTVFSAAGLEPDEEDYEYAEPHGGFDSYRNGYLAIKRLLERRPDLTAIIAFDDSVAIGAMRGAQEMGIHIPRELSIIGVDDSPQAEFANPPLTTVRLPSTEAGEAAAEMALGIVAVDKRTPKVENRILKGTLMKRESTGVLDRGGRKPPRTAQGHA